MSYLIVASLIVSLAGVVVVAVARRRWVSILGGVFSTAPLLLVLVAVLVHAHRR